MDAGRLIPRDIVKTLYDSEVDGTVYKGWTRQATQHLHETSFGNVFMLVLAEYDDPGHYWASIYVIGNTPEFDHFSWEGPSFHEKYNDSLLVLCFPDDNDGFRLFDDEDLKILA